MAAAGHLYELRGPVPPHEQRVRPYTDGMSMQAKRAWAQQGVGLVAVASSAQSLLAGLLSAPVKQKKQNSKKQIGWGNNNKAYTLGTPPAPAAGRFPAAPPLPPRRPPPPALAAPPPAGGSKEACVALAALACCPTDSPGWPGRPTLPAAKQAAWEGIC